MSTPALEKQSNAAGLCLAALAIGAAIILACLPFLGQLAAPSGAGPVMDPNFRVPALPVDSIYYTNATRIVTWIMAIAYVVGILTTLPDALRRRSMVPIMLALSGVMPVIPEVYFDVMGMVWFPVSADDHAFTIIGRQMSWAIVAMWGGFAGPFLYQCYAMCRKSVSDRTLWLVFIGTGLASVVVEETLLHFGQYYYYGNQPLILFAKYPWWWLPCNAGGLFLAAALVYRLEAQLQGWRSLAILLITPMSIAGIYGFIAMPAWIAVSGNYSALVTNMAGLLTITMGMMAVSLVIKFVVRGGAAYTTKMLPSLASASFLISYRRKKV